MMAAVVHLRSGDWHRHLGAPVQVMRPTGCGWVRVRRPDGVTLDVEGEDLEPDPTPPAPIQFPPRHLRLVARRG